MLIASIGILLSSAAQGVRSLRNISSAYDVLSPVTSCSHHEIDSSKVSRLSDYQEISQTLTGQKSFDGVYQGERSRRLTQRAASKTFPAPVDADALRAHCGCPHLFAPAGATCLASRHQTGQYHCPAGWKYGCPR